MNQRLPEWLKRKPGASSKTADLKRILRKSSLNTVCEEARCPNIEECFSSGTATFMILGDICTRGCRFCSVHTGKPLMKEDNFEKEAHSVLDAVRKLELSYVVITSVARDDLADGGASGFVANINLLKKEIPDVKVEVLVPDFRMNQDSIKKIADTKVDVINHNLETVPRLYRKVRPGANYKNSLRFLEIVKEHNPEIKTKTGIMLGLGEEKQEVIDLVKDCKEHKIDIFTAGQYMRPTLKHLEVEKYLTPSEFENYSGIAKDIGIEKVFIGPLVRSSYHAGRH